MKLVLILALLNVVSLADQKYDNVTKANGKKQTELLCFTLNSISSKNSSPDLYMH